MFLSSGTAWTKRWHFTMPDLRSMEGGVVVPQIWTFSYRSYMEKRFFKIRCTCPQSTFKTTSKSGSISLSRNFRAELSDFQTFLTELYDFQSLIDGFSRDFSTLIDFFYIQELLNLDCNSLIFLSYATAPIAEFR